MMSRPSVLSNSNFACFYHDPVLGGMAYRTGHNQHQHQHQHQQLAFRTLAGQAPDLPALAAAAFTTSRYQTPRSTFAKMEYNTRDDDLQQLEKLSNEYAPEPEVW